MIDLVINWIKSHSPSGVLCWEGGDVYPEVTGYLIPTLLKYDEYDLARQYADYLLSIQNKDGSFNGMDGKPKHFDTAAIYEGLTAIGDTDAAEKAKKYLEANISMLTDNAKGFYLARACGLIGSQYGKGYWTPSGEWDNRWGNPQRLHYIAYGLEGLYLLGIDISEQLRASLKLNNMGLMPYFVSTGWVDAGGIDISATCQMAILYKVYGLEYRSMIEAVEKYIEQKQGPVLSWAGKFYLDIKHET